VEHASLFLSRDFGSATENLGASLFHFGDTAV
jgi:hypothetical protein